MHCFKLSRMMAVFLCLPYSLIAMDAGGKFALDAGAKLALDEYGKDDEKQRKDWKYNSEFHRARDKNFAEEIAQVEAAIEKARSEGKTTEVVALLGYLTELKRGFSAREEAMIRNALPDFEERAARNKEKYILLREKAMAEEIKQRELEKTIIDSEKKKEASIEAAKIAAEQDKQTRIEVANIWAGKLSDPKVGGLIVGTAAGIYGVKHAMALIAEWWSLPELAQKTSIRYWGDEPIERVKLSEVILEPRLKDRARELQMATSRVVENNTYFRNMLLYGPTGTGKTLLAMALAVECGLEYIYFSAGKLEMYSTEEAIKQLVSLFEKARSYDKKLMIIIDEADIFCADRSGKLADKTRKLLNTWLTYTGTECRDYMVVAITNRFEVFDDAVKSRFGVQLEIGLPGVEERKILLSQYASKYLEEYRVGKADTRSFFQKLYKKSSARAPLAIESEVLTPGFWDKIAEQTEGFAGRDISDLCLAIQHAAFAGDRTVSADLVHRKLGEQKEQVKKAEKLKSAYKQSATKALTLGA